jgi:5-methyltetrahydrofolate--homocysteine methyltransferase
MEIIGEKINGTRKRVATAITNRDKTFIQDLAQRQEEGGAHWLDVNAGTHPDRELEDLVWLVDTIQAVVQVPLCLDSANPEALTEAIKVVDQTPMINSISGEPERLESILPLVAEHGCSVIALAMDGKAIPKTAEDRLAVIRKVVAETRSAGVADANIYVDTLAMTISTDIQSANVTLDTIRAVRTEFPQVHLTLGLSNISFGLPVRGRINRVFLVLAMVAGLDSAIVDPLDREMRATILTTELLLGRDRHCLNYTRAFRAGLLES